MSTPWTSNFFKLFNRFKGVDLSYLRTHGRPSLRTCHGPETVTREDGGRGVRRGFEVEENQNPGDQE